MHVFKSVVCGLIWTNAAVLIHDNMKMCRNCFNDYNRYALKYDELKKKLRNAMLKLSWTEQNEEDEEEQQSTSDSQGHVETTTTRKRTAVSAQPRTRKLQALQQPIVIDSEEDSSILFQM